MKELADGNLPLYVATGTLTEEARRVLEGHGLLAAFRDILGGEHPKRARLEEVLARSATPASAAVLVGDSRQDLLAAHRVGLDFQLVTRYGFFGHDRVLTGAVANGARWAVDLRPDGPVSGPVTAPAHAADQEASGEP